MSNVNTGPALHHDAASRCLPALAVVERRPERTLGDVAKDLRRELALLQQSNREALSATGLERLVTAGRGG